MLHQSFQKDSVGLKKIIKNITQMQLKILEFQNITIFKYKKKIFRWVLLNQTTLTNSQKKKSSTKLLSNYKEVIKQIQYSHYEKNHHN